MRVGVGGFMFWQILPSILCLIFRRVLSHREQVCLMRLFREILLPSLGLVKHIDDVMNLLCYKNWTDKRKYIPYISVTHNVLKSCRSKMATWPMIYVMYTELHRFMGGAPNQPKSPSIRLPTHQIFIPSPPKVNAPPFPTKLKFSRNNPIKRHF